MADQLISSEVYLSRDKLRLQLIEYMKLYMELQGVDLTKQSFVSYIVNILTTLSSNLLFYGASTYNEFFLTKAKLPESIYNLAAFLGYTPTEARAAIADVLMAVPLTFENDEVRINIPEDFTFYAGSVPFKTFYNTELTITNNSRITLMLDMTDETTGIYKSFPLPYQVDSTNKVLMFVLPTKQRSEITQEYTIDSDIKPYQFYDIAVNFSGKMESFEVTVRPPGSAEEVHYYQKQSLFMMDSEENGYVLGRTINGRMLTFGNGFIGTQPKANSTVTVVINSTEGADGNVYSGAIGSGDRLYFTSSDVTMEVQYYCTNPESAVGGLDEESLQTTRNNAINNLVSLNRLVTEYDYIHMDSVIKDGPFNKNSLPVLKRSDLRCNEIQTFTTLSYTDSTNSLDIVPTKNLAVQLPYEIDTIDRWTSIYSDEEQYYSLFELQLDKLNGTAHYYYILDSVEVPISILSSYSKTYRCIQLKLLNSSVVGGNLFFAVSYDALPDDNGDYDISASCTMEINGLPRKYSMLHIPSQNVFVYPIDDNFNYSDFPDGDTDIIFTLYSSIEHPSEPQTIVTKYTTKLMVRQDLEDVMMSNIWSGDDSTTINVYDIPVVKATYYNGLPNKKDFELNCIQKLIAQPIFEDYRMLTDFANLKFANTTGYMVNMLHNTAKYAMYRNKQIISFVIDFADSPPTYAIPGNIFIVGTVPTGEFRGRENQYAICVYNNGLITWEYLRPVSDDIVYVTSKSIRYIYTGDEWMIPIYTIPLKIELEVFRTTSYFGTDVELEYTVKSAILNAFSSRFGINIELYTSEIIDIVQEVYGVDHCTLINPRSDIFFNYDINKFTQEELLSYTPEYIYFGMDDITIVII